MLFLRTPALSCRALTALRRLTPGYTASRSTATYVQGQSPEARIREYFYYIDHQGQLFLDDTKMKNFVTCFKDKQFLVFFFSCLRSNQSGRYEEDFPFLSLCGRERNFLRCDDRPVVFTHLLQSTAEQQRSTGEQQRSTGEQQRSTGEQQRSTGEQQRSTGEQQRSTTEQQRSTAEQQRSTAEQQRSTGGQELLSYCGGEEKLSVPFRPDALYMHPVTGRVYHPCPECSGGVGLVRSALAIELSPFFVYPPESNQSGQPTHFLWRGQKHRLTNELAGCFPTAEDEARSRESSDSN